jgi:hypothetical protein
VKSRRSSYLWGSKQELLDLQRKRFRCCTWDSRFRPSKNSTVTKKSSGFRAFLVLNHRGWFGSDSNANRAKFIIDWFARVFAANSSIFPEALSNRHRNDVLERNGLMDRTDVMFETDPIVSQLYLETFKRRRLLEPEKELMLAILTDAIECLHKHCDSRQTAGIKLFQEANEWIFDADEKGAFSFLNVCDALELDPCYIRKGIANLKSRQLDSKPARKKSETPLHFKGIKHNIKERTKWSLRSPVRGYRAARPR